MRIKFFMTINAAILVCVFYICLSMPPIEESYKPYMEISKTKDVTISEYNCGIKIMEIFDRFGVNCLIILEYDGKMVYFYPNGDSYTIKDVE